ncbi:MAG: hypothetical protein LBP80_07980 [Treponema sp.]|jgi:hypothetical protein|nr:hypothetical protein [Treponema sp.]
MKKIINFTLLSLLVILFSYSQQQTGDNRDSGGPIDLVVLVDTSPAMRGYYREFISYVSGPFLREFLRIGDTFHILSFSGSPKTELVRRIEGVGDVETIIARLYLLYPLGNRRDLNGALDYAESYTAVLPNRPGKLVLFTAGTEAVEFTRSDTDFYLVRFPLTGPLPVSGRPPRPAPSVQTQPQQPAAQAPQAAPAQAQPRQPAQTPRRATPAEENSQKKGLLQLLSAFFKGMRKPDSGESPVESASKGEPAKKEPVSQTASAQPPRPQAPQAAPVQPPVQTQPPARIQPQPQQPETAEKGGKFPFWILLSVVLMLPVIAVIVFLFFVIRRKFETIPVRAVSYVAGRTVASPPRRDITVKLDTNPMVYLEVDYQNRNIGRRNTHFLKAGSTYTVGGGNSDFLIFLVPVPRSIGIVRFDGRECTFIPKKLRYFPEISGEPVPDCIGKTIRVISDSGYTLSFRFRQYEDPLLALNRAMNATSGYWS